MLRILRCLSLCEEELPKNVTDCMFNELMSEVVIVWYENDND
jgi:hypothetical protein